MLIISRCSLYLVIGAGLSLLTACGGGDEVTTTTTTETPPDVNQPAKQPAASGRLLINEVDYDQAGSDVAEFVELYNDTGNTVDMSNYRLVFVNGSDESPYMNLELQGSLAQGEYFVVADAGVANLDLELTGSIQNGAPDGIRLETVTAELVDSLSYEGAMIDTGEGGGTSLADDGSVEGGSLCRIPDGTDTDDNSSDFVLCSSTPGKANIVLP